jgi:hypothetical protein
MRVIAIPADLGKLGRLLQQQERAAIAVKRDRRDKAAVGDDDLIVRHDAPSVSHRSLAGNALAL